MMSFFAFALVFWSFETEGYALKGGTVTFLLSTCSAVSRMHLFLLSLVYNLAFLISSLYIGFCN